MAATGTGALKFSSTSVPKIWHKASLFASAPLYVFGLHARDLRHGGLQKWKPGHILPARLKLSQLLSGGRDMYACSDSFLDVFLTS